MSFQEFVSSGFGLWMPDDALVEQRKKDREADCGSAASPQPASENVEPEERETKQRVYIQLDGDRDIEQMTTSLIQSRDYLIVENERLKAENEKWKAHVESLITDTRRSLEEIKRQAGETVRLQKELQELKLENENLRNENAYRHIIMRQMKKKRSEQGKSVFEMINPCL